jgi:hypothetical protein
MFRSRRKRLLFARVLLLLKNRKPVRFCFLNFLSFFLSVLDFILFLCFYLILFVKFTKLKSPAMQILQSFKLVTYFQRFVINSPQNTDKFRAEKIEAFIFGMESEKNSK